MLLGVESGKRPHVKKGTEETCYLSDFCSFDFGILNYVGRQRIEYSHETPVTAVELIRRCNRGNKRIEAYGIKVQ